MNDNVINSNELSTVSDEVSVIRRHLKEMSRSLDNIEKNNKIEFGHEMASIRETFTKISVRGQRAEQISRGLKIHKTY